MATLHHTINDLASQFAHDLLRALRGASLEEIISETSAGHTRRGGAQRGSAQLLGGGGEIPVPFFKAPKGKRSKRLTRRSADDLRKMVDKLIEIVRSAKNGINAEGLKAAMKIERRELPRPLGMALKSGKIRKRGQKRATTYFAGGGGGAETTAKKAKPAKKRKLKRTAKKSVAKKMTAKRVTKKKKRTRASTPKAVTIKAPAPPAAATTSV